MLRLHIPYLFTHSEGERERTTARCRERWGAGVEFVLVFVPVSSAVHFAGVAASDNRMRKIPLPPRDAMVTMVTATCDRWTDFRCHCRSSSCCCVRVCQCVTVIQIFQATSTFRPKIKFYLKHLQLFFFVSEKSWSVSIFTTLIKHITKRSNTRVPTKFNVT